MKEKYVALFMALHYGVVLSDQQHGSPSENALHTRHVGKHHHKKSEKQIILMFDLIDSLFQAVQDWKNHQTL